MSFASFLDNSSSRVLRASLYHSSMSSSVRNAMADAPFSRAPSCAPAPSSLPGAAPPAPLPLDGEEKDCCRGEHRHVQNDHGCREPGAPHHGIHIEQGALLIGDLPVVVHAAGKLVLAGLLWREIREELHG